MRGNANATGVATLGSDALAQDRRDEANKARALKLAAQWRLDDADRLDGLDALRSVSGTRLIDMGETDWDVFIHSIPALMTQAHPNGGK
jgi:hypothetical protein